METVYCPNGHSNEPDAWYCATCLVPLKAAAAKESAPPEPARGVWRPPLTRTPPTPESLPPRRPLPQHALRPRPAAEPAPDTSVEEQPLPEIASPPMTKAGNLRPWLFGLLALAGLALATLLIIWLVNPADTPPAGESTNTDAISATTPADVVAVVPTVAVMPTATAELVVVEPTLTAIVISTPTEEPEPTLPPTPTAAAITGMVITPTVESMGPVVNVVAVNQIQNGDFSSDWENGWIFTSNDSNGTRVIEELPTGFDAPGRVLSMGKTGSGFIHLTQQVVIDQPVTDTEFQARLRQGGSIDSVAAAFEGRSALILVYESEDGIAQGASIWFDGALEETIMWAYPPLSDLGPNLMARYADTKDWYNVDLSLSTEFETNLPDIDPDDVSQITIMLLLQASDECLPAACLTTLEVADLRLTVPLP